MKTAAEIRLDNLVLLIAEMGSQERVAEAADTSPVYLSQIVNKATDSKTGRTRQIGDDLARKLEAGCGKERGWLDNPQVPHSYRNNQLATAMAVMENMDADQLARAVKIVAALAEPPKLAANGRE